MSQRENQARQEGSEGGGEANKIERDLNGPMKTAQEYDSLPEWEYV